MTPPAQAAVNAYIANYNLGNALFRNPAKADPTVLRSHETGQAYTEDVNTLRAMAKQGIAYRGTPARPRVKVVVANSQTVVLADCGLISASDPYVRYNVKTGAVIPPQQLPHPPPYLHEITVRKTDGAWKVSSVVADASKTCTP